jgi:hypothetical protein
MRLLQCSETGDFHFAHPLTDNDNVPPYAILSHTWRKDDEEVTFDDLMNGTGKDKLGYEKLRFCGEQARRDDLEYFWIDTCCIDKSNPAELQKAVASMFRWYQCAKMCYVYLSDVSLKKRKTLHEDTRSTWEQAVRRSRWFTRGWTLQELLAPTSVVFFSKEGSRIGDKQNLEQIIQEVTGIPALALRGLHLSRFSIDKRLSWIETRKTKLEEDKVYSLLGIFDANLPLLYGEGRVNAFRRLLEAIDKREKCIRDLRTTDPGDDKKRIEDTHGGLLEDSSCWIFENPEFQHWRNDQRSRLLWVNGDPGKGKTMLLCSVINELDKPVGRTYLLSYFFCQATDPRINNATAVLRGLIYILVDQQPSLVSHIQKKYDYAGKTLFEDVNAWVVLSEIFASILHDQSLNTTYLVIDALDECIVDLPKLLSFITGLLPMSSRVKWIVSSRNWPQIEQQLGRPDHKTRLSLELNPGSISKAVGIYIRHKVLQLVRVKGYNDKTRDAVIKHLSYNAGDTFLWVALVCRKLEEEDIEEWDVFEALKEFPRGLKLLYLRMLEQIRNSRYADLCKDILVTMAIVYRPITLAELMSLVAVPGISDKAEQITRLINLCGSYLTIRDSTIYFVHQSAKDFLLEDAFSKVFSLRLEKIHHTVLTKSLQVLSSTLRQDIYELRASGCPAEEVKQPHPDPLTSSRYACVYWVDHLCEWLSSNFADYESTLQVEGIIEAFISKKYLYWLEALSICGSMPHGVLSLSKLDAILQVLLLVIAVYIKIKLISPRKEQVNGF